MKNMVTLDKHKTGGMKPSNSLTPNITFHCACIPLSFFPHLLGSANCTFDNDTQKGIRSQSLSRACMRIVLQQVGICFAHVILKSVVSGWLWDR